MVVIVKRKRSKMNMEERGGDIELELSVRNYSMKITTPNIASPGVRGDIPLERTSKVHKTLLLGYH
jgi:hypothetical protein